MINNLCHMGGRYLVTMILSRMERYWGSVLICATYMGMFWRHHPVIGCVWGVWCRFRQHWIPSGGARAFWILAMVWVVCDQLARDLPTGLNTHWNGRPVIILTPHTNKSAFVVQGNQFECNKVPFGLQGSPFSFARTMAHVLMLI